MKFIKQQAETKSAHDKKV
uniref:Uncharacterized protein n=1 Tax=Anguilla anguilla TaxID=7936 RepID=A0A0E9PML8_ANGAN